MKKITVSIDDETHRLAKAKAAEKGTSVSALVRNYLNDLGREESAAEDSVVERSLRNLKRCQRVHTRREQGNLPRT